MSEAISSFAWLFHPLFLSFKVLLCCLVLLLSFGLGIACFLAFSRSKFRGLVDTLVMFWLIFPPIATGFLLLFLLGKNGLIGKAFGLELVFSFNAVVLAAFLAALPLFVKPVSAAFMTLPKTLFEAGASLGKNSFEIFVFIVLPNTAKTIAASLILALARAVGEVGITLMLGGNIVGKTDTISLAIFNSVYDGENERALVLSLVLVAFSAAMFWLVSLLERRAKI